MYFYKMRNEAFIEFKYNKLYLNRRMRFRYYVRQYKYALSLLLHGRRLQAMIVVRSIIAMMYFNPKIQYLS